MILWTATILLGVCLPSATLHDAGLRFLSTAFSQRCCSSETVGNHTANGLTMPKEGVGKGKKEGVCFTKSWCMIVLFKNRNKVSKSIIT